MPLVSDPEKASTLLVLDMHNFMLRCYFAKGFSANAKNKQGYKTGHVYLALQKLRAALKMCTVEKTNVCLMLSAQENSHVRRKMYKPYKANRIEREYESYEVTDIDGNIVDRIRNPIEDGMEMLMCFPCCNLEIPNADGETDDVLGVVVKKYGKTKQIYIVTEDRDAWALIRKNVVVMSKPEELYGKEQMWGNFGIRRGKLLPLVKALFGDTSDNIENVPGLSADTYAASVVEGKENHYLEISNILNGLEKKSGDKGYAEAFFRECRKSKSKKIQSLLGFEDAVAKRERMIRLRTKIDVKYVNVRGDARRLTKLLAWYDIKKDAPSFVAIATGNVK